MPELIQKADFMFLDWIQSHLTSGWLDRIMPVITFLGDAGWLWITITILFLLQKRHRRCGLMLAAGLTGSLVFGLLILKNIFARSRPCWINPAVEMLIDVPADFSFPSGHTMSGMVCAVILLRYDRRYGIPALILACLIAFSRMYLYVHFPTDILGGALIGVLMAFAVEKLFDRFMPPENRGSG